MNTTRLTYYSPLLWEMVEQGKISKKSALYRWLNSDQGQVVGEDKIFYIETFGLGCSGPNKTAFAELKTIMKQIWDADYLYDRFPVEGVANA